MRARRPRRQARRSRRRRRRCRRRGAPAMHEAQRRVLGRDGRTRRRGWAGLAPLDRADRRARTVARRARWPADRLGRRGRRHAAAGRGGTTSTRSVPSSSRTTSAVAVLERRARARRLHGPAQHGAGAAHGRRGLCSGWRGTSSRTPTRPAAAGSAARRSWCRGPRRRRRSQRSTRGPVACAPTAGGRAPRAAAGAGARRCGRGAEAHHVRAQLDVASAASAVASWSTATPTPVRCPCSGPTSRATRSRGPSASRSR